MRVNINSKSLEEQKQKMKLVKYNCMKKMMLNRII